MIHGDLPDDAVTKALYRVWCAATDSATSPDFEGDDEARERYRLSVMAEARKELTGLTGAAIAMTAMHDVGRRNLRTTAHLRVWLVARQRGIANTPDAGGPLGTEDGDALSDAALDAVFDRMAEWAAERDDEEPEDPAPVDVPGTFWCEIHQAYHLKTPGDVKGDPLSVVIPHDILDFKAKERAAAPSVADPAIALTPDDLPGLRPATEEELAGPWPDGPLFVRLEQPPREQP